MLLSQEAPVLYVSVCLAWTLHRYFKNRTWATVYSQNVELQHIAPHGLWKHNPGACFASRAALVFHRTPYVQILFWASRLLWDMHSPAEAPQLCHKPCTKDKEVLQVKLRATRKELNQCVPYFGMHCNIGSKKLFLLCILASQSDAQHKLTVDFRKCKAMLYFSMFTVEAPGLEHLQKNCSQRSSVEVGHWASAHETPTH